MATQPSVRPAEPPPHPPPHNVQPPVVPSAAPARTAPAELTDEQHFDLDADIDPRVHYGEGDFTALVHDW